MVQHWKLYNNNNKILYNIIVCVVVRYTRVPGIVCEARFEDIPSLLTSIYLYIKVPARTSSLRLEDTTTTVAAFI